jgi:hypothetical protein
VDVEVIMKNCIKCHETKPLACFLKDKRNSDGHTGYCRKCANARHRERYKADPSGWRRREREYARRHPERVRAAVRAKRARYPDRDRARHMVAYAVEKGEMVRPSHCERCDRNDTRIEAHHPDYSRPLDVEWICTRCHAAERLQAEERGLTLQDARRGQTSILDVLGDSDG